MKKVVILVLIVLTGFYLLDNWLTHETCQNTLYEDITSPSSEYKVVVFERDCGATTRISSQVSIIKTGKDLPNSPGNIFISETDSNNLKVNWLSAHHVEISFPENIRTFKQEEKWKGVKISYNLTQPINN